MKRARYIVCTERTTILGRSSLESLWILPREMDWTSNIGNFNLLGTTHALDHMPQSEHSMRKSHERDYRIELSQSINNLQLTETSLDVEPALQSRFQSADAEDGVREKLIQLLHALWLTLDYHPMTIDQGIVWLGTGTVKQLLAIAEVFELLERKQSLPLSSGELWEHSLRTGSLAGLIAKEERSEWEVVVQSCLAGFSHDIGLAILAVSLDSTRYLEVMAYAQRQTVPLATSELLELGISHEIVGAEYLQRRKFPNSIVTAVSFHDNPLGSGQSGFTPTIAVYAANILDGGGWPQDSDGVPSSRAMEYLSAQGFVDPWPKWQRSVTQIRNQEFGHA